MSIRHGSQRRIFSSFHTSYVWKKYSSFHALGPPTMKVGEYTASAWPKNLATSPYRGT
ncbi:hypothetical protein [Candidatus Palauibacter sp.]|uniref:hypothetical protein n=1 Tax=Candidatus Palauibacter sp. TaxID=3101350 RepID=UPI003B53040D